MHRLLARASRRHQWRPFPAPLSPPSPPHLHYPRSFRSDAALEALLPQSGATAAASGGGGELSVRHLALYNYPSFSGAFAALFAHLYHSRLDLPFLALPFSSVDPLRVEDLKSGGFETCYLLDFIGPNSFSVDISRFIPRVIAFDHRKSTLARASQLGRCPDYLELRINTSKSSACAVYDFFLEKLNEAKSPLDEFSSLLSEEDENRLSTVLRYIEDADLQQWKLPNAKEFNIGIRDERAKLNCITNPYVFKQLLGWDASKFIVKGDSYVSSRQDAANKLLKKPFTILLGRGLYGECLAIRADGYSDLSDEIGTELSRRSATAGLRPIGAVVFMQRGIFKMCLRSTDKATNTSEIAKAYGGGGNSSSSSFPLTMDEYNHWTSTNS
ncbi:hypothetical protein ACMD2_10866 [Ananas comosus]|uniref:Uncharacterized protein n=1 Tax=Ananas comosus TaxID=4615 RepID=A0A199VB48_ANACO|nr:hypothetical protein ACMD2_10866 [Ananas comosus]